MLNVILDRAIQSVVLIGKWQGLIFFYNTNELGRNTTIVLVILLTMQMNDLHSEVLDPVLEKLTFITIV